jgi:hypothetical protein
VIRQRCKKTYGTPKQAAGPASNPANKLLQTKSANQAARQFLVLDIEIDLGGGAVLQNLGSVQLHVE